MVVPVGLRPLPSLLVQLLKGHSDRYADAGLFALLMATGLVKGCLQVNDNVHCCNCICWCWC